MLEQDAKEAIKFVCLADDRFAEQSPGTNIFYFIPNLNKEYVAFTFSKQIEADLYSPRKKFLYAPIYAIVDSVIK